MLHSIKMLDGFSIVATDGEIGKVKDIYFDDAEWTIRYLQVDTGWLTGRKVLISPILVTAIDWNEEAIHVRLNRQQVNDSPGFDTDKPVSRQHETDLSNYYGYPYYWTGPYVWGYTVLPTLIDPTPFEERRIAHEQMEEEKSRDPHLRSKDEVVGYAIQAVDDEVGHVDDFLFDEDSWTITLMVIDTRNWLPGKHVLISPKRIERVSWEDKSVVVNVARDQIENSPEYDENAKQDGGQPQEVYWHLGRPIAHPVAPRESRHHRNGK